MNYHPVRGRRALTRKVRRVLERLRRWLRWWVPVAAAWLAGPVGCVWCAGLVGWQAGSWWLGLVMLPLGAVLLLAALVRPDPADAERAGGAAPALDKPRG